MAHPITSTVLTTGGSDISSWLGSFLNDIASAIESVIATIDWGAIEDFFKSIAPYFPVAIAGTIVWGLWIYRFALSRRARPILNAHRATTSVVVPSFHEDPDILMQCLESWRAQGPDEIQRGPAGVMDAEATVRAGEGHSVSVVTFARARLAGLTARSVLYAAG